MHRRQQQPRARLGRGGAAVVVVALLLTSGLAACGGADDSTTSRPSVASPTAPPRTHRPAQPVSTTTATDAATAQGPATGPASGPSSSTPSGGAAPAPAPDCPQGTVADAAGQCVTPLESGGASAPVNSAAGQKELRADPDCQGVPPPPPGYTGPVQC